MDYLLSKVPIFALWQGILHLFDGDLGRNWLPRGSVSGILLVLPERRVAQSVFQV